MDSADDGTQNNSNSTRAGTALLEHPPLTRRALREREQRTFTGESAPVEVGGPALARQADVAVSSVAAPRVPRGGAVALGREARPAKARFRRVLAFRAVATGAVMAISAALVATVALPSYAYTQEQGFNASLATAPYSADAQILTIGAGSAGSVSRDNYDVPTQSDLDARAAAAAAATAAQVRAASSSVGNANFTVNAPSGPYSGSAVVAFADQFVGKVPYGSGASPDTSFGCDGLVQYVFAAFGIHLPRGVSAQAAMGVRISPSEVQAGDLVVWPGQHIAIADGHGGYVNSPDWGRYVEHTSNWWGSYYFVRLI